MLPKPLFQNSFLPESATIVVPDQPTSGDLQAALAVAAGFGRMTDNKLGLTLTPLSKLPEATRDTSNL